MWVWLLAGWAEGGADWNWAGLVALGAWEGEYWTLNSRQNSVRACPWDSLAVVKGRLCPRRPGTRVLGREFWGESLPWRLRGALCVSYL